MITVNTVYLTVVVFYNLFYCKKLHFYIVKYRVAHAHNYYSLLEIC